LDYSNQVTTSGLTYRQKLENLTDKVSAIINTLGGIYRLIEISNYLDIDVLKVPLANYIAHDWQNISQGDREKLTALFSRLQNVDENLLALIAKYWYLNYGQDRNYISPKLDYGFSIEELQAFGKLPVIENNELDLNNLRINNLTGLQSIAGIAQIITLNLRGNQLTALPLDIFKGLNHLQALYLDHNQLIALPSIYLRALSIYNYLILTLTN